MHITIFEEPIPKARPRSFLRGKNISTFDPQNEKKKMTKLLLQQALSEIYARESADRKKNITSFLSDNSLAVHVDFYFKIPSSYSASDRNLIGWGVKHHKTCDIDNCIKYILDCANEILWTDDRHIIKITSTKNYDTVSRTEIFIRKESMELSDVQKQILGVLSTEDIKNIIAYTKDFEDLFDMSYLDDQHKYSTDELVCAVNTMTHIAEYATKFQKINKILKRDSDV